MIAMPRSPAHAREARVAYLWRWFWIGVCAGFWVAVISVILPAVFG